MQGQIEIKVYYEHTDCLGVVYYANYLNFLERGRTELINSQSKPIQEWNKEGYYFAVFQLKIIFHKPARLGDICQVITVFEGGSEFRKKIKQRIERNDEMITEAQVDLVCLNQELQLREFPPDLFE